MERLTKAEEPVMQVLWEINKGFVKDILDRLPNPKPPYNTVSSVVRILVKKGFVNFKAYGKTYEYFPAISQPAYKKFELKELVSRYFEGSPSQLVSFLIEKEELDEGDITELKQIINQKK